MAVPLSYGLKKEKGVPLDTGIREGVPLDTGLDIKPKNRFEQYRQPVNTPFRAKHPNLYGMYGASKELGKQVIPFIKYIDPDERQKFLKLSQQHQTRDILFETMNAVLLGALKPIGQGVKGVAKPAFQRWLPKTYSRLTKPIFEKSKAVIPEFKTTGEAARFGRKATTEDIAELQKLRKKAVLQQETLQKAGKLQEASDVGYKAQLYREAIIQKTPAGKKYLDVETAKELPPDVFYRGTVPRETKRIETLFPSAKGKTWVARKKDSAKLYGESVEKITAKHDAKILKEGTREFAIIAKTRKDIRQARGKTTLIGRVDGVIKEAKKQGYDAVSFKADSDIGTVILNESKFIRDSFSKYAGSINLQRQAISNEAKRAELELFQKAGVKTKVTHEEIIKDSLKIVRKFKDDPKFYAQRIEKIKAGHTPSIKELTAHRVMNATDQEVLIQMAKGVDKGNVTKQAFNEFKNAVGDRQLNVIDPIASDAGRRLNSFNIMVGRNRAMKALNKLTKPLNKRQRKVLSNLDPDDPIAVEAFVKDLPNPELKDYFYEYWYNQILSGIPTHVVNVTSNTMWRMFQVPHRAVTGGIDAVISTLTGRQRTRYINETIPLMAGFLKGKGKAAKSALEMVRHGKLQEFETKWAKEIGGSLGAWDKGPNMVVRGIGKALTVPTKALRAMDVYANSLAYDGQMNALARRASNLKGLKGAARKEFEKKFVTNPSKAAHDKAMEFAKYTTFMSDPGWLSKGIMGLREKIPGARLVVPFVNTIGNLTKRGVEMTPGLGLTLAKGQNPSEVIAKQIEGAIVSFYMLNQAAEGKVTGALPENKTEREAFYRQGKKPWAMKVGDTWAEYRRVEPANTILASTAIAYDRIKNAKDEEAASEIFFNMAGDLKNNLLDSGYLQGVTRILNRHGGVKGMAPRLAASFVPYSSFFRSIDRAYEAATEGSAKVREGNEWLKAFSQTIPGLPKTPVRLNVWGEEIELQGGVFRQWLPYRWSTETDDITEQNLEKLKVYPGLPGKKFTYKRKKHEFDEDIYRNYTIAYGKRAKEYLDIKFSQPLWKRAMKDEKQHDKIKSKIDRKLKALRYKEQRRAVIAQRKRWKIKKLSGL